MEIKHMIAYLTLFNTMEPKNSGRSKYFHQKKRTPSENSPTPSPLAKKTIR